MKLSELLKVLKLNAQDPASRFVYCEERPENFNLDCEVFFSPISQTAELCFFVKDILELENRFEEDKKLRLFTSDMTDEDLDEVLGIVWDELIDWEEDDNYEGEEF